jgi:hypothetical protein
MIKLASLLYESKQLGDCYLAAGKLAMDNEDYVLVHGMVSGRGELAGKRFGHAWVEDGDTVLDYSNGNNLRIPKEVYYAIGNIKDEDCIKYTSTDACVMMLKEKHWGPWEMSGETVDENIPDESAEIGKEDVPISPKYLLKAKRLIQND